MTFSHKLESFTHAGETYALSLRIDAKVHLGHQCSAPDLEDDPSEVELYDLRVEDGAFVIDGEPRPWGDLGDNLIPRLTKAVNDEIETNDAFRESIELACIEAAADDYLYGD